MNKVERVARGMYEGFAARAEVAAHPLPVDMPKWPDAPEQLKEHWRKFARDAIAALSEQPSNMEEE